MGEHAEYQWVRDMRLGLPYRNNDKRGRNPIDAHCPYCGKGIRPVAGIIKDSMIAHIKAKHREVDVVLFK